MEKIDGVSRGGYLESTNGQNFGDTLQQVKAAKAATVQIDSPPLLQPFPVDATAAAGYVVNNDGDLYWSGNIEPKEGKFYNFLTDENVQVNLKLKKIGDGGAASGDGFRGLNFRLPPISVLEEVGIQAGFDQLHVTFNEGNPNIKLNGEALNLEQDIPFTTTNGDVTLTKDSTGAVTIKSEIEGEEYEFKVGPRFKAASLNIKSENANLDGSEPDGLFRHLLNHVTQPREQIAQIVSGFETSSIFGTDFANNKFQIPAELPLDNVSATGSLIHGVDGPFNVVVPAGDILNLLTDTNVFVNALYSEEEGQTGIAELGIQAGFDRIKVIRDPNSDGMVFIFNGAALDLLDGGTLTTNHMTMTREGDRYIIETGEHELTIYRQENTLAVDNNSENMITDRVPTDGVLTLNGGMIEDVLGEYKPPSLFSTDFIHNKFELFPPIPLDNVSALGAFIRGPDGEVSIVSWANGEVIRLLTDIDHTGAVFFVNAKYNTLETPFEGQPNGITELGIKAGPHQIGVTRDPDSDGVVFTIDGSVLNLPDQKALITDHMTLARSGDIYKMKIGEHELTIYRQGDTLVVGDNSENANTDGVPVTGLFALNSEAIANLFPVSGEVVIDGSTGIGVTVSDEDGGQFPYPLQLKKGEEKIFNLLSHSDLNGNDININGQFGTFGGWGWPFSTVVSTKLTKLGIQIGGDQIEIDAGSITINGEKTSGDGSSTVTTSEGTTITRLAEKLAPTSPIFKSTINIHTDQYDLEISSPGFPPGLKLKARGNNIFASASEGVLALDNDGDPRTAFDGDLNSDSRSGLFDSPVIS